MNTLATGSAVERSAGDAGLVDRARAGDQSAFAILIARYQGLVCAVAYASTGNAVTTEDVAQDTFVKAWERLEQLRDPGAFRAWLCTTARNLAANTARDAGRRRVDGLSGHEQDDGPAPDDTLDAAARERVLWACLSELPTQVREPLVLHYREGLSARAIGELLGLAEATVRQRIHRGRSALRDSVHRELERSLQRRKPQRAFVLAVFARMGWDTAGVPDSLPGDIDTPPTSTGATTTWLAPLAAAAAVALVVIATLLGAGPSGMSARASGPEASAAPTAPARPAAPDFTEVKHAAKKPPTPGVLAIRVEDLDGHAIAGATVWHQGEAVATTNARGTAEVPAVPEAGSRAQPYKATAPRHAPATLYAGYSGALRFQLLPQSLLLGHVIEYDSRDRVPHATVRIDDAPAVTTDAEGHFEFGELAPGHHTITAVAEGLHAHVDPLVFAPEAVYDRLRIELHAGAPVEGTVFVDGHPPGAGTHVHSGPYEASVEADGAFRFPSLPAGATELELHHPDGRFGHVPATPLTHGDAIDRVHIKASTGVSIALEVVDDGGTPIAGVSPTVGQDGRSGAGGSCTTGADGVCTVHGFQPGPVLATLASGERYEQRVDVPRRDSIRFVLPRPGRLRGRVVDPHGVPQPNITVWPSRRNPNSPQDGIPTTLQDYFGDGTSDTVTDAEGYYYADKLAPGTYDLRVYAYGNTPQGHNQARTIQTDADGIVPKALATIVRAEVRSAAMTDVAPIQIAAADSALRGVVVDGRGTPVAGALVTYFVEDPGAPHYGPFQRGQQVTRSDAAGAFHFKGVSDRWDYTVTAHTTDGGIARDPSVPAGGTARLELQQPGCVRVIGEEPWLGVTISMDGEAVASTNPKWPSSAVTLCPVRPGTCTVLGWAKSNRQYLAEVEVEPDGFAVVRPKLREDKEPRVVLHNSPK